METYRLLDKLKETIQSDFRGKKVRWIFLWWGCRQFWQFDLVESIEMVYFEIYS